MSFIHYTIVGHFDPATLSPSNIAPLRPLDENAVDALLGEYPDTVREQVDWHDGYVQCCWAGGFPHQIGELVHEFAYKLAEREHSVAAESPVLYITYPEEAKQIQAAKWRVLREKNPPPEAKPPMPPAFNPPESGPCLYCGKPLRTSLAKQCRFCKKDWHDRGKGQA